MKIVEASEHGCEEANLLSKMFYIPCNRPATHIIDNGDKRPYRMCDSCTSHNVRSRGAKDLGPYIKHAPR